VKHGAVSCVDPNNNLRIAPISAGQGSSNQGVIIGLSVGLGCAVIIVIVLVAFIVYRSRASSGNESV